MYRWILSCLAVGLACSTAWAETPREQQSDRRDRMFPELVVESGGRRGTCDALAFTRDGKHLLAVGDDKVVRVWEYRDGRIDPQSMKTLRWSIWGPQRGAIYALAVSPDPEERRIAIGGLGMKTTAAAVLDRQTGETLSTIYADDHFDAPTKDGFQSVRAIAFRPPRGEYIAIGSADGSVWLWRPLPKEKEELKWLGKHSSGEAGFNRVRFLHFVNEEKLLSVAENGEVFQWDVATDKSRQQRLELFADVGRRIHDVVLSPDGEWLAARATKGAHIYLRSFDGQRKNIELAGYDLVSGLAFDPNGGRLAAGVRSRVPDTNHFSLWSNDQIHLYDLRQATPTLSAKLPHAGRVDVLAFHPDGNHLAVAGGDNHEVTLWELGPRPKRSTVQRGAGSGIWNVALCKGDSQLAFQTQCDPAATHPNRHGRGPWTVFDLKLLKWSTPDSLPPNPKLDTESDGWQVKPINTYVWHVWHPGKRIERELPWDRHRQETPNCYVFLPPMNGQPVRLAVGHYRGLSIFEVSDEGVKRIWWGMGHEGEVMSLAVSAKGDWLVSASNDQTIAAWSLERLGTPELGARFQSEEGRIVVTKVDLFSPAWECGLVAADEIVQLEIDHQLIFRSRNAGGREPPFGTTDDCLEALTVLEPGKRLRFRIKRGRAEYIQTFTHLLQRPLWRFFPTRQGEWVLWMWGYHYYECSDSGDSLIGWQMNNRADIRQTPSFSKAEQFRDLFYQPAVIAKLLDRRNKNRDPRDRIRKALEESDAGLVPPKFDNFDSVSVRIKPAVLAVKDAEDVELKLEIQPRSQNPDFLPRRAELWINDHRLEVWNNLDGKPFHTKYLVKSSKLRRGDNDLTLQCYNTVEGRGEGRLEASAHVRCDRSALKRDLRGLVVSINNYSRAAPLASGEPLRNLNTPLRDMQAIAEAWASQKGGKLYSTVDITPLNEENNRADRKTILEEFRKLAGEVGPDDQVFVFLAGHGTVLDTEGKNHFVFCCQDFDPRNSETSISARELYKALAEIPCRKALFLDVCHSGEVVQPVRDLTPGGRGPIILAACARGELSWEPRLVKDAEDAKVTPDSTGPRAQHKPRAAAVKTLDHSFFVTALLEAFQRQEADQDNDGLLDAREIFDYTSKRVPALLREAQLNRPQTPTCFPYRLERQVLLARTPPPRK
jgi:WD40 repeat protein